MGKYKGSNDRIKKSEERQNKLALVAGITLKVNFEQRRSGWGNEENKPSCFECGSTEHFKALCPIWLAKRRKIAGIPAPSHNQNEKGKGKGKGKGKKGKERKGKERKGKEWKGKERKGKERKGKERKGKERSAKVSKDQQKVSKGQQRSEKGQ